MLFHLDKAPVSLEQYFVSGHFYTIEEGLYSIEVITPEGLFHPIHARENKERPAREEAEAKAPKMCQKYLIMANALKYRTFAAYNRLP